MRERVDNCPAVAYVGVGSNINPEKNIVDALAALEETRGVTLTGISTFFRTAALPDPGDSTSQPQQELQNPDPDFLNGVLEIRTTLSPTELLALFAETERTLGRKRPGNRYAPRTIDLDLLLLGLENEEGSDPIWQEIGPTGFLTHPDIERRPFVAHPLLELAPNLILPPYRTPLRAFAASFDTPGGRPETVFTEGLRSRFVIP
ncbi:MAG: 2-amino-4-hydroxy-6-hydroxymethyldihydropteridine diphosphokinase [Gemmatimonadota bacterium]